ncbi:hypothetical protein DSM104299_03410 [Baekduia alba]|uniref:hypothetical protein n=1 Tax=Baekduia alba TaxID=2997333 RepID=UPI002341A1C2|nr:hypothetical protein [Baekduia alba]WCB94672.1 hypothetical protein DSM104299_03410 [Baekduia alba]
MTDERDDIEPDTEGEKEQRRPDPRLRPPDPAGTQPQWDPQELLPKEQPLAAAGRLWAPPDAGDDEREPEAERVVAASAVADAPAAPAAAPVAEAPAAPDHDAPRYSRYSGRFQFLLGALLAIGAAAIVLLVAALASDDQKSNTITLSTGPTWSAWHPTGSTGSDSAQQIAEHVGHQYRLPNGQQLVAVTGGPLQIAGLPVTIAIQRPVSQGGDIDFVEGTGVLYRLCGVGATDCRIAYGKPSVNRALLLRREALELALYSFRYLGVTETVVLLPPSVKVAKDKAGKVTTTKADPTALLFRRETPGVSSAVAHPLNATLSTKTPSVNGVARSPDAGTVSSLTGPNIFTFRFQESNQDARAFLVLNTPTG